MQKITPFLWFNHNAEEAVTFYTSMFKNSKTGSISRYDDAGAAVSGQSKGSLMTASFQLDGQEFVALNGGPHFTFNPSISFFVNVEHEADVESLWRELKKGGKLLMELQQYNRSETYGWLQDRFGVSWQISLGRKEDVRQLITPSLLFVGKQCGKAEEAIHFYTSIFNDSDISRILRYNAGEEEPEGTVKYAQFTLNDEVFMAMDSSLDHPFTFNEAVSFVVNCDTQEEVDYFWERLSAVPQAEQCGWLKDKFGVSWQIVPIVLNELLSDKDSEKSKRVMQAMLQMKKIDIGRLQQAYES